MATPGTALARPPALGRLAGHYLPDLVYGANDGIITTFAVVSGVVGASLSERVIVILGLANLIADGFSMGASNYLARRSHLEEEIADRRDALRHGLATIVGFVIAGVLPLVAYLLPLESDVQFPASIALAGAALFAVGAARTFVTRRGFVRSGAEMLLVGSLAAVVAFGIGALCGFFCLAARRSFPQPHSATARMARRARSRSIRLDNRCKEATMRVSELMTEKVLTIGPEAPIKDVAKILVANGISGLPVCDIEGRVLGVISEGDILYKEHDPTEGHIGGPLGWIIDGTPNNAGYVKAKALTARKAMTAPAITIAPWESAPDGRADHVRASRQPAPGREGRAARRDRHPRRPRPCLHPHRRRDRA